MSFRPDLTEGVAEMLAHAEALRAWAHERLRRYDALPKGAHRQNRPLLLVLWPVALQAGHVLAKLQTLQERIR